MSKATGSLVCAQAAELRGTKIDERRGEEIAADIGRINDAAGAARTLLDFNDEPSRFVALLSSPAATRLQRR